MPGSADWALSHYVHELMVEGAHLCARADHVVKVLGEKMSWQPIEGRPVPDHLPPDQQAVLGVLAKSAASTESICARSGLDARSTFRAIAALELDGFIGPAPGGMLRRLR